MESSTNKPSSQLSQKDLKTQFQGLITQIQKDSDILVQNLQEITRRQNQSIIDNFEMKPEKACDFLTNLATQIFKAPVPIVNQLFRELDLARAFEFLLGKIFKEVLKISNDFINTLDQQQLSEEQSQTQARVQSVIYNAISFISIFGHLFDYLLYDSHRFEIIIEMFTSQKSLLKLILSLLLEATKIQALQRRILEIYAHRKRKEDDHRIIFNFAKILFNLIISPINIFKIHFVEEQGIYILKKIMKKAYQQQELEIYFYCLGIIPPVILTQPQFKHEFIDNCYGQFLSEHLTDFYQQGEYLHICSPLLLAIRALICKSDEIRKEFLGNESNLDMVFEIANSAYGNSKLKNIYISAVTLMCEIGFANIQTKIVTKRQEQLKEEFKDSDQPGADIKLKELTNRLQAKVDKFAQYQNDYTLHQEALKEVRNNLFDDSELEKSLVKLNQIWQKSPITKSFFITSYGNLDQIIQCLKNLDESVMLNSLKCLQTILYKEDGAQDLFLRHKGITTLKNCLQDYHTDIKKCSLSILCMLIIARDEAKMEIVENGVIEQCISHIDKYPEDEIDHEILCLSLYLVSQAVLKQPKIQDLIVQKGGLNKIVMQFKIVMDQMQKKPDQNYDTQLLIFDKLCLAIINITYGSAKIQDLLRTELQIFNQLTQFLTRCSENLNQNPVYNEDTISNLLNLLVNAIDTNKANQEFFLKNFRVEPLVKTLLNLSLKISGLSCLLLSHLVWASVDGQALFSSREVLKRLVFLMDFNQLINEGEAEASVESLMEVSFYALLALINLSHGNLICQQLTKKFGCLQILVKLLKSPSFDPKKTACLCLGNLIQNNQENIQELLNIDGVSTLVNLINDEEDDDLSNKAYQCLEYMGSVAVFELVKQLNSILSKREVAWKFRNTIMIDVFMNRERHILSQPIDENIENPSSRTFGPQDKEDLIDLKNQEKLEKILPVLNGLIYLKQENRDALLKDTKSFKSLFEIFRYQLPIEVHENALYALLNLVMEAKKSLKEQLVSQEYLSYLTTFIQDLHNLEMKVLRQGQKFLIADYGIKVNYEAEQEPKEDGLTIEQMQATVLDIRVYEYLNTTDEMYLIEQTGQVKQRVLVEGRQFEGQGLKKHEVIKHLGDLRALGYSILNQITLGNSRLSISLIKDIFSNLPKLLVEDVMISPSILENLTDEDEIPPISENLWEESLELLLNLITIKEALAQLNTTCIQVDLEYLDRLKGYCQKYQVKSGSKSSQQKGAANIGKITQVINEIKGIN